MFAQRTRAALAIAAISALALAACSASEDPADPPAPSESTQENSADADSGADGSESEDSASSVTVEDNHGTHTIDYPIGSVIATDNRTFETLYDWGIELTAAAVTLMPDTIGYKTDESIIDIGNHREPNLELIVAAEPDLVINGQRYQGFYQDIVSLVPDATVIELDPRDGEPWDQELKRQVTVLGEIFGKQAEAQQLVDDFDGALERIIAAYDPAQTVMALNVSGGEIGYLAPGHGRTLGPLYPLLGLTSALEVDGSSDDHEGDEVSVEAIASANPDWILVMDRSASVDADNPEYRAAIEIIEENEALANVTAVQEGRVIVMPPDTYTNEGIQTYTEYLNQVAEAFEAAH